MSKDGKNPASPDEEEVLVVVDEEDSGTGKGKEPLTWEPPAEDQQTEEEQPEEGGELSDAERQAMGRRAKKRIERLLGDKTHMAQELAAKEALIVQLQQERSAAQVRSSASQEAQVAERAKSLESELVGAKSALKLAREASDVDAEVAAHTAIAALSAEKVLVERVSRRMALEKQLGGTVVNDEPVQQRPAARAPQAPAKVSERAVKWLAENPWFGGQDPADQHKTRLAYTINQQLQGEGVADEEELFDELDRRMNKYSAPRTAPAGRPSQRVVGGGRPAGSPQPGGKKQVVLTPNELAAAKKWGITPERWAKEKLKKELKS